MKHSLHIIECYRCKEFLEYSRWKEKKRCKKCDDEVSKETDAHIRKRNHLIRRDKDRMEANPVKHRRMRWSQYAAYKIQRAIKDGAIENLKVTYKQCVDCGKRALVWEHRDYEKPLDVVPCCYACNSKRGSAIFPEYYPPRKVACLYRYRTKP